MSNQIKETIQAMNKHQEVDVSMYDESFLRKSIERRSASRDEGKIAEYIKDLSQNTTEAKEFYDSLNITYSEFFRNSLTFALLEERIIPKLIEEKSGSEIRIWSAGCAQGQEAYSIAILLDMFETAKSISIPFRIIATDVSESALAAAHDGIYNFDTLQNLKLRHLNDYFTAKNDTFKISDRIKRRVSFSSYNLLDKMSFNPQESIFGGFDIIFCSNLLFYYRLTAQQFILQKVMNSMNSGGYLITGDVERSFVVKNGGMRMVAPPSPIFQLKKQEASNEYKKL